LTNNSLFSHKFKTLFSEELSV